MNHQELMNEGLEYMRQHHAQQKSQFALVSGCAAFLKDRADISDATAERIAVKALGEYERHLHDTYIDMDASTSHTIFIKSRVSNVSYAFTAAKLELLMRCHAIPIS